MTLADADRDPREMDATRRIEVVPAQDDAFAREAATARPGPAVSIQSPVAAPAPMATSPAAPVAVADEREAILYVPLAVTVGDGFKFGCGFFMAFILAMLFGFVLLSALFLLTSLMGLNLPVGR